MEEYVRERLKFRISYWQEQFKKWQKRWNLVGKINKDFKVSSLSDEAFAEIRKIPLYVVVAGDDLELPFKVQERFLKKVFICSDPEATKVWKVLYGERFDIMKMAGWTTPFGLSYECYVFINCDVFTN
jgi:hypothetical protein